MKYKTITFDANRPIPQQITEPLNSDYGVAVKVYKDGLLVDADLSVDGVACVEAFDGWKLCDLSTNSEEGTKKINVTVDSKDGLTASFPLYVQQKDLGYIEVIDNSAEPEPTPDPEESVEP